MSSRRRYPHRLTDAFAPPANPRPGADAALFGGTAADHFRRIPVDRIHPREGRARRSVDPERLAELADSIRAHGVLQPIRLRARGAGEYEIIAGERRWLAARQVGLRQIPAVIAVTDDATAVVESLIENVQREDLNAVDRADALRQLRVNLGLQSWEEVGRVIGLTRQHVHNLLRIGELPEGIQDDVRAGELSEKHCRALLRLRADPEAQESLWEQIHRDGLSGDSAMAESKRIVRASHDAPAGGDAAPPSRVRVGAAVDTLMQVLGLASMDEISAVRSELEELHELIGDVLASLPGGDAMPAALPHDGAWHSMLVPVAGHPAS